MRFSGSQIQPFCRGDQLVEAQCLNYELHLHISRRLAGILETQKKKKKTFYKRQGQEKSREVLHVKAKSQHPASSIQQGGAHTYTGHAGK